MTQYTNRNSFLPFLAMDARQMTVKDRTALSGEERSFTSGHTTPRLFISVQLASAIKKIVNKESFS